MNSKSGGLFSCKVDFDSSPKKSNCNSAGARKYIYKFFEYIRWKKIFLRILNKSKDSIGVGLDSIVVIVSTLKGQRHVM